MILDDEGNIRENELTELLDGDRVRSLFVDSQDRLWICTYGSNGLVCADGKKALRCYTCELEPLVTSDRARCITELSDGSLAVGTADGIPVRTLEDWEAARRTPPEYIKQSEPTKREVR